MVCQPAARAVCSGQGDAPIEADRALCSPGRPSANGRLGRRRGREFFHAGGRVNDTGVDGSARVIRLGFHGGGGGIGGPLVPQALRHLLPLVSSIQRRRERILTVALCLSLKPVPLGPNEEDDLADELRLLEHALVPDVRHVEDRLEPTDRESGRRGRESVLGLNGEELAEQLGAVEGRSGRRRSGWLGSRAGCGHRRRSRRWPRRRPLRGRSR